MLKSFGLSRGNTRSPFRTPGSSPKKDPRVPRKLNYDPSSVELDTPSESALKSVGSNVEKVIKALSSHVAKSRKELSYREGDFFYVIKETKNSYYATNPISGTTGKVKKTEFVEFGKTTPKLLNLHDIFSTAKSIYSNNSGSKSLVYDSSEKNSSFGVLHAMVSYDFEGENAEELNVSAGEKVIIYAHHDFEWFISKRIDDDESIGLVPTAYLCIIDPESSCATGNSINEDIKNSNLPNIEEWKSSLRNQTANTITLDSIEQTTQNIEYDNLDCPFDYSYYQSSSKRRSLPPLNKIFKKCKITRVTFENEKYWFELKCKSTDDTTISTLKRYYEDFFELQAKIYNHFPEEAGILKNAKGEYSEKIIPNIPSPAVNVNEKVAFSRKHQLNKYLKSLLGLPDYILQFPDILEFFEVKNNAFDFTIDTESSQYILLTDSEKSKPEYRKSNTNSDIINFGEADNILTGEDLKLFERLSLEQQRIYSDSSACSSPRQFNLPNDNKTKIKFYYQNDIFVIRLKHNISLFDLRKEISERIRKEDFKLSVKLVDGAGEVINLDEQVSQVIQGKMKISVLDL